MYDIVLNKEEYVATSNLNIALTVEDLFHLIVLFAA